MLKTPTTGKKTNFEIICSKMLPEMALYYSSFEFAFSLEKRPLAVSSFYSLKKTLEEKSLQFVFFFFE